MIPGTSASEPCLQIDVDRRPDVAVVRLFGSATMDCIRVLSDAMSAVADEQPAQIIIDCSGLDFLCFEALGVFIVAHTRSHRHGGAVKLAAPRPHIAEMLAITKLNRVLPTFATIDQALAG